MANLKTGIQWTDVTWNPVTGCTKVSPGCKNCYAEALFSRPYPGRKFTEVKTHPERLEQPLSWRKPQKIFVNSMGDLFHEDVPDEFILQVFTTMFNASQHTFQVLTKRPDRMRQFFLTHFIYDWPLQNCWLGVSVENQATADERIPLLLQTPAAVRFLSVEPLLEFVDLDLSQEEQDSEGCYEDRRHGLHWTIVGGESGPGARLCDMSWIRSIVEQCKTAQVPVFVKQLGRYPIDSQVPGLKEKGLIFQHTFLDKKGGDIEEWPIDLRIREFPRTETL